MQQPNRTSSTRALAADVQRRLAVGESIESATSNAFAAATGRTRRTPPALHEVAARVMAADRTLTYDDAFGRVFAASREPGGIARLLVEANGVSRDVVNAPVPRVTRDAIRGPSMAMPPMVEFDGVRTRITKKADGLAWQIDFAPAGKATNVETVTIPSIDALAASLMQSGIAPAAAYAAASEKVAKMFAELCPGDR